MKKLRTIVIVVGVALVFILIAALAIIVARGGKLTGKGQIIETGIIRIFSKPEDVKVFVDGEERTLTDRQIGGLEDKEYQIKLTKDGYSSWEKTVQAKTGIVVEVFAQLFPTSLNLTEVTKTNIDKAFYSADGQFVVYAVKSSDIGSDLGLWRLKLTEPTITLLQNRPLKISNITTTLTSILKSNYVIDFSPDNKLIKVKVLDNGDIYILNADTYNEPGKPINSDLGYTPDRVDWFDNSSLIISKDNVIFEYNSDQKTSRLISYTPDNKPVYSVNKNRVIFYNHNLKRVEAYESGKSNELIAQNVNLPKDIIELQVSEQEPTLIIFKTEGGYFYLNTEKGFLNKIGENLTFIEFARDGKSALFTNGKDILSYTVEEYVSENRFEAKLNTVIANHDPAIHKVKISPDSQHILISDSSKETLNIQVCDKDGQNLNTLINDGRINDFSVSIPADSSTLFLLLNDEIKQNEEEHILRTNLYKLDLEKS